MRWIATRLGLLVLGLALLTLLVPLSPPRFHGPRLELPEAREPATPSALAELERAREDARVLSAQADAAASTLSEATARASAVVAAAQGTADAAAISAQAAAEVQAATELATEARRRAGAAAAAVTAAEDALAEAGRTDAATTDEAMATIRRQLGEANEEARREIDRHHRNIVVFALAVGALSAAFVTVAIAHVRGGRRRSSPVVTSHEPIADGAGVGDEAEPAGADPLVERLRAVEAAISARLAAANDALDAARQRDASEQAAVRFASRELALALERAAAASSEVESAQAALDDLDRAQRRVAELEQQAAGLIEAACAVGDELQIGRLRDGGAIDDVAGEARPPERGADSASALAPAPAPAPARS